MDGIQRGFADGRRLNRRQNQPQTGGSGWLPGNGMTYYPNTRFFSGSNPEELSPQRTRRPQRNAGFLCVLCVLRGGIFAYRPNCTVTRDPAGTCVPGGGVWMCATPLPTASSWRPASSAASTAPRNVLPMNVGTSMPPCSTSRTTVPVVGAGFVSESCVIVLG